MKLETWVSVLHFLLTFTVLFIRLNKVRKGEERGKEILFCFLHVGGFLVLSMLDQVMWKRGAHFFEEEEDGGAF